ncbi:Starch-binding associating with outer membrane [Chitinophaga sp. YR573]|uniref:RagB/SusD family nutrient uptake outer membrane protein n=1 Tax=Chitinophaga sp. YR573 TaxID=1881040 RepID=UPI0008C67178|nr:RagB/SusD family nutrient uptake outer membrane protein [Chitinophaga sp. YR573]SEW21296.1 Starch-binding associating with outer membrane [Chitinophaga sp. YR573]
MELSHKILSFRYLLLITIVLFLFGCTKYVEVNPPITSTNSSLVFKSDATAIAAVNNLYVVMSQQGINSGVTSLSLYASLSADDLSVFSGADDPILTAYYKNSLSASQNLGPDYWTNTYSSLIYTINSALDGLDATSELTPTVKEQLVGQCKFLRAFYYFNLVNLYGDVPLVLTTDYKKNASIARASQNTVYEQIILDLKDADSLLYDGYLDGTLLNSSTERIVPNKWAAKALLARCYLYTKDWVNAENESSQVIANTALYDTVSLNNVFLANSKESIWQLQSVSSSVTNTSDAYLFILPADGPNNFSNKVYLNSYLVDAFESGDQRFQNWVAFVEAGGVKYYYPDKYKVNDVGSEVTERTVVLRLAEQYLIRAEARTQLENLPEAITDLNVIRVRAGLAPLINNNDKAELMSKIVHERQVELFTEYGHRWFDLKRLNHADNVLQPEKGASWQSTDQLYPIPASEIAKNTSLSGKQNPGY